jgi:thiol-disulfide isomerase/thioredoxin
MLAGRFRQQSVCRRARPRQRQGAIIGALLGAVLVAACQANVAANGKGANSTDTVGLTTYPVQARELAPALSGKTLNGRSISLASLERGDIVVINVWASWCGPCRDELPKLAAADKQLRHEGVQFLGLDERDVTSKARAFVASTGASYPNLVDTNGELLQKLRPLPQAAIPSTLVLDRHGRMAARVIGPITSPELRRIMRGLRSEA